MRAFVAATLSVVLLAACGLPIVDDDPNPCSGVDDVAQKAQIGPSCNGTARRDECTAAGLPDVYGVDDGCEQPFTRASGECLVRHGGIAGCVTLGGLVCCPKG